MSHYALRLPITYHSLVATFTDGGADATTGEANILLFYYLAGDTVELV